MKEMNQNFKKPKILLFDIETAPAKGWFFGKLWETNIIEVEQHGYMLSFSAKWLGEKKIYTYTLNDFKGHKAGSCNDKNLLVKLSEMLNEADIVIAHNGDRFDITTTNTRLIANGLPPLQQVKTVDTLKVARNKFKFLSNKLDDLGSFLGVGRKIAHTGKHLWFGCMNNDLKSWKTMKKYNEQDVKLLEAVYLKLRPWMTNHPNIGLISDNKRCCPNCGGSDIQKRGTYMGFQRWACMNSDCKSWHKSAIKEDSQIK